MFCLHPRGAGRRHNFLRGSLLAAGTMAATLSAGAPALADMGSTSVLGVVSPDIEINSDGEKYTAPAVAHAPVTADVKVWLDPQVSGRIKNFKVWLKFRTETSDWIDFRHDANSASFPVGQRPKKLNKNYLVSVSSGSHATYLAGYCNAQAQALRLSGVSNEEIFSQDRPLEVAIHSGLEYEMSGLPGRYSLDTTGTSETAWSDFPKMSVICKGVPTPKVEQATLAARRGAALSNACSLDLSGEIHTDLPNTTVKFRYHSGDGRKSDVKTVVTNQYAIARFSHEYPLPDGGTRSDKIRIVGENIDFSSLWASFESDCDSPTQDIATALPPKATDLEAYATGEEIMHRGLFCPAKVKIWGVLEGRGMALGAAVLVADGDGKGWQAYQITEGQKVIVQDVHTLTWGPTQARQNVKFGIIVINKQGDLVDQMEVTQNFVCREPQTLGDGQSATGVVTVLPPKATGLEAHATGDEIVHRGLACPAKVKIWGVIKGRGSVDGHVALAADGKPKALEPYSIGDGQTVVVSGDHTLAWGPTQAQQNVKFAMYVTNKQGDVVDQMETTQNFTCRETSGVAEGAVGGVSTGKPAPTRSQQSRPGSSAIGRLAQQQAQAFAIQAPKGLVRQGQIRLAGGAANAKYSLKFLRKSSGGYVAVNAAQLPKQMTGLVASFPLQALTGGRDWRLEVCPLGDTPTGCQTADFRLTRIGAGAGAATPSPEQPQGSVFIFPGAAN